MSKKLQSDPNAVVVSLTCIKNHAKADGVDTNKVVALVARLTDGTLVSGQSVNFSSSNGTITTPVVTDASGTAIAMLTSTTAGSSEVQAELNRTRATTTVTFD
ncbi:Ig-like domain-containing protein [Serratia rhizosphaerae]|uniref:Big-1 domain-containing protein n=1 Tax=Serratia rhizosphaerae TaxID=2597702 RepID=A0ABX6GHF7_9GAMM|nr:Ig-like domain-containing protein [Serratia rhizosphaerae]QHA85701.1 hypothetical protein FO014_01185 [Serratia rhizosphaerae]